MVAKKSKKNAVLLIGLAILGLTIFSFMGCGGSGGGGSTSNNPAPAPADINVSKTQIALGDVVLDSFSEETISIQNTGSSNLIIGQIAQANPLSAPFSILNNTCNGTTLAPSTACTLQVRFSPTVQAEFTGAFDIPSNDPDEVSVTVSISGYGRELRVAINQVYTNTCPKISFLATITDRYGNPVTGLTTGNFSLFESGLIKGIQSISQATSPISTTILMDYSGSMLDGTKIPDMEAAAKGFIDQLKLIDEASIVKYAADIILMQDFTTDKNALKAAIGAPYPGSINSTRIYDAVWQAVDAIAVRPNRHAIIAISDGFDDASSAKTLAETIGHAYEAGINVFTIGLGTTVNEAALQQLADGTGGVYFFAPTSSQLGEIYLKIAEILAGQYVIEYNSSSSGAGPIILTLEVTLNNAKGRASKTTSGCQ